jgi:two-component system OmpR family response regulator
MPGRRAGINGFSMTEPAKRILIAEDDANIRNLLSSYLSINGFETDAVGDGSAALKHLADHRYDLVVLDIMLPGTDGLDVCRKIRQHEQLPVLLLTALGAEDDRIEGFQAGADDYMVKPFSPRELVARVGAILRRTGGAARQGPEGDETGEGAISGDHPIQLDWAFKSATYQGEPLDLTQSEFKIMAALMRRPGVVFSRGELLDILYPHGESVVQKAVDVHIHNIRKKLGKDGARYLQTVRSFGYRVARPHDVAI